MQIERSSNPNRTAADLNACGTVETDNNKGKGGKQSQTGRETRAQFISSSPQRFNCWICFEMRASQPQKSPALILIVDSRGQALARARAGEKEEVAEEDTGDRQPRRRSEEIKR